jgi:hypothetical protein
MNELKNEYDKLMNENLEIKKKQKEKEENGENDEL